MKPRHVVFLESNAFSGLDAMRQVKQDLGATVTFLTCDRAWYGAGTLAADRVIEVERTDGWESLRPAVERLQAEQPIDAFLTFLDTHIIASAEAAAALGLPHLSVRAARNARDKPRARELMRARGIPQPAFARARRLEQALAFAAAHGYPFVAKPADGTSSTLARAVTDEQALRDYFEDLRRLQPYGRGIAARGEVILEQLLDGPLVSVEMVTAGGRHHLLGLTDRQLGGYPQFVELGGSFPVHVPDEDAVVTMARQALDALGIDFGPSHTEMILTAQGPRVVEVNARLAGGVVPTALDAALGRRILVDVVRLHLGEGFAPVGTPRGVATIQAFCTDREGELAEVVPSPSAGDPRVLRYQIHRRAGQHVSPLRDNNDRLGFVVVLEKDLRSSRELARKLFRETRFVVR